MPADWRQLRVDNRARGNIGGRIFELHSCGTCYRFVDYTNTHTRAVEFLRASIMKESK